MIYWGFYADSVFAHVQNHEPRSAVERKLTTKQKTAQRSLRKKNKLPVLLTNKSILETKKNNFDVRFKI